MHAEPQIHSSRLCLRTSHTHTNTHNHTHAQTALSGDPSGPVVFLYQVGLATSQPASHHMLSLPELYYDLPKWVG